MKATVVLILCMALLGPVLASDLDIGWKQVKGDVDCWSGCGNKRGSCPTFCGDGGYCCHKGYGGGCPAGAAEASPKQSTCVALFVKYTDLETKLTDLEDVYANTQTKYTELENCLADISSADCPLPPIGKTAISDIQEDISKLKPKLNLVVIAGNGQLSVLDNDAAPPEVISPSGVCQGIPPLNPRVIHAQAVYIDNKLMVCGGSKGYGSLNSCQVLDESGSHWTQDLVRQWTQGPTMNEARHRFTITKAGQDLYALGGFSKEYDSMDSTTTTMDSMEKFSSGEWTKMNQKLPKATRDHCTVFMETTNSLVVIGGYLTYGNVDEFSLSTSTWNQLAPTPEYLMGHSCVVLDQKIVATGGHTGSKYNNKVYQLAEGIWKTIGQLEVPRSSFSMGTLDGKLLVIGGWNGEYLDSIEEMQKDGSFKLSKLKLSTKIMGQATTAIPREMFNC